MRLKRSRKGSIAAEQMAALMVLFLGLFFPLCNIATTFFRYGLVLQAVQNGAHVGSTAQTWTAGSSPTAVMDVVPATIINFCNSTKGLYNPIVKVRMIETDLAPGGPVNRLPDNTRLNPATQPRAGFIYSIETTLDCDIDPLVPFRGNLVPQVPAMTAPYHARITTRQLLENPDGMKT
jgi:hypothetical protein